jgi:hypothetical protein
MALTLLSFLGERFLSNLSILPHTQLLLEDCGLWVLQQGWLGKGEKQRDKGADSPGSDHPKLKSI